MTIQESSAQQYTPNFTPTEPVGNNPVLTQEDILRVVRLRTQLYDAAVAMKTTAETAELPAKAFDTLSFLVTLAESPKDYEKSWVQNGAGWRGKDAPTKHDSMVIKGNDGKVLFVAFDTYDRVDEWMGSREPMKSRIEKNGFDPKKFSTDPASQLHMLQLPFMTLRMVAASEAEFEAKRLTRQESDLFEDGVTLAAYFRDRSGGAEVTMGVGTNPYNGSPKDMVVDLPYKRLHDVDTLLRNPSVIHYPRRRTS